MEGFDQPVSKPLGRFLRLHLGLFYILPDSHGACSDRIHRQDYPNSSFTTQKSAGRLPRVIAGRY
jgi:hypothetical protein